MRHPAQTIPRASNKKSTPSIPAIKTADLTYSITQRKEVDARQINPVRDADTFGALSIQLGSQRNNSAIKDRGASQRT